MLVNKKVFFLTVIFSFNSINCARLSHLKSGHFVTPRAGDSWEKLSKRYKVAVWQLKSANFGRSPKGRQPLFIPRRIGILGSRELSFPLKSMFNSGLFTWPVPSSQRISSGFGQRWGRPHQGIDIPAKEGTPIVAAADGVVLYSGRGLGGYGNLTVLAHPSGLCTVYAHAYKNYTRKGERVRRGQIIALVGQTGKSTGSHLHFEVRYDSRAIDPRRFASFKR